MRRAYLYYPGCTLETSAREYDLATRHLMAHLGTELVEIDDWTCCGASAAEAHSPLLALCLAARNLALASTRAHSEDLLVPCSACYLNLRRAAVDLNAAQAAQVNTVLAGEDLHLGPSPAVRHLLDVLSTDVGPAAIDQGVTRSLAGLKVAAYYGCQCLRPYRVFDDPEKPTSMDDLITATGADLLPWEMGARCCGAAHMTTRRSVGLALVKAILKAARGADLIVTVCPMCQLNLEAHQGVISRQAGEDLTIPVLYLPQLLGLALGLDSAGVGLSLNLALPQAMRTRLSRATA